MASSSWWSSDDDGITISLRVIPGARRSEVVEHTAERLRIRIAAPAVDGKANEELRRLVAGLFGVRRSAVSVVAGTRSREKRLHIAGVSAPPSSLR
jgi:uncharacterized protein (TIGR00251 family)